MKGGFPNRADLLLRWDGQLFRPESSLGKGSQKSPRSLPQELEAISVSLSDMIASVMRKTGLLLINLGTPNAPSEDAVRDYLREFLMDPYVIDIAWPLRFLLVHGIILRKRPAASAEAYQKVWTERGSPLRTFTEELTQETAKTLAHDWSVKYAMRYGTPSIEKVVEEFAQEFQENKLSKLIVIPLYPQYSTAATESSLVETRQVISKHLPSVPVQYVREFYDHPAFLDAFAEVGRESLKKSGTDFVLFSFHGLPERQVQKLDKTRSHCLKDKSCCEKISEANRDCYRAQCYVTARGIAERMGLDSTRYEVAFQSRLDQKWIRPFTDDLFDELPKRGVKRISVMCPSFVADCLETLEEVQIRGREQFIAAGGTELHLVPSLNSSPAWVRAVAQIAGAI